MPDPVETPIPPPPTTPWFDTFEPELKDVITKKAWDKLDPAGLAKMALTSYHTAEKLIGAPAGEMVRIPKPDDQTAWDEVYTKFGVPKDKAEYKLTELKGADGNPLNPELMNYVQDFVHDARLRPDQATKVTTAVVAYLDSQTKKAVETSAAAAAVEFDKLKANWGGNFDLNDQIATRAANRLGMTPENLAALKNAAGVSGTMEMLLNIGKAMGEARFVTGGDNVTGNTILSADQAETRKQELMKDASFRARWVAGDSAARKEMSDLNYVIVKSRYPNG